MFFNDIVGNWPFWKLWGVPPDLRSSSCWHWTTRLSCKCHPKSYHPRYLCDTRPPSRCYFPTGTILDTNDGPASPTRCYSPAWYCLWYPSATWGFVYSYSSSFFGGSYTNKPAWYTNILPDESTVFESSSPVTDDYNIYQEPLKRIGEFSGDSGCVGSKWPPFMPLLVWLWGSPKSFDRLPLL